MTNHLEKARDAWERLYSEGHQLDYPNDVFVRVTHRLFDPESHRSVYDHGCGSGENLIHLARRGFAMTGGDVSASAVSTTQRRVSDAGLDAEVCVIDPESIPFDDGAFDAAFSWQVLTYNTPATLESAVTELRRVVRPGGLLLVTLTAPGDYMQLNSRPLGDDVYELHAEGQEGTSIMVIPEERVRGFFPDSVVELGWFGHDFASRPSRHWIVALEC